ncbi:helix-turn-helix domain-containing protein [Saccharomonospora xinjiangensis]|uniref:helix-turn-helix domain-containing protein n=1 Tax=Saccharomonospora xinjiangensis TaxID=75294 RepID=UPI00106F6BA7|nr:helix-turn-helix transcriptional regulator [Saccharomonospora xinjiangensis]
MPWDTSGLTTRARALTAAIRRLVDASGMSGREISQRLGFSHGTVSHWATGRRLPNPEDTASLLTLLGVTGEEKQRLVELARHAAEPNWLVVGMPGIPQQLAGAIESERHASAVVEWARDVVPGLLQTADYARALAGATQLEPHEVDARVMLRVGRSEVVTRRDPLRLLALIAEDAVREIVGSPPVMADQLRHLVAMGGRDNITVQIVPPRIGWHPGWAGPFVLYEFPDAPPVVHFEHYSSGAFVLDEDDVEAYRKAVEIIRGLARSPAESADLLMTITEELEAT